MFAFSSPQRLLLLLCLLLVIVPGMTQEHWMAYFQKLNITKYTGQRFRATCAIRTELHDDSANARLWVRIDKPTGTGFFENMDKNPVRDTAWKVYKIEGMVDSSATDLSFGLITMYNGKFYFDDLQLEVESTPGKWVSLFRSGFEKTATVNESLVTFQSYPENRAFKPTITTVSRARGSRSLMIAGTNVPNYGINKKAGRFADVNGLKLYYEIYGKGKPLVILHGNGGSIRDAGVFMAELSKKYKLIGIDSRAQGKSGDTDEPITYELMASDINQLLKQLDIDSALIWGHSDGAILGLIMAIKYPSRVSKLVSFGANIQPDSSSIYQWFIDYAKKNSLEAKDTATRKLNKMVLDHPNIPYSELAKIDVPVLVMAGDRDMIRPEHTLRIFQHIPKSQLFIVPGATHGAAWEKQELFLKVIHAFFDEPFTMPDTKNWFAQ